MGTSPGGEERGETDVFAGYSVLNLSVIIIKRVFHARSSNKIEGVVLNRVCVLGIFCSKQGQGFKPSAAHLYPNIGRVPPRGGLCMRRCVSDMKIVYKICNECF